jgi:hypothetical protein
MPYRYQPSLTLAHERVSYSWQASHSSDEDVRLRDFSFKAKPVLPIELRQRQIHREPQFAAVRIRTSESSTAVVQSVRDRTGQ